VTDEDVARLRALERAATPRPWRALPIRASYDAKIQRSFVRGLDDGLHVAMRLTADDAEFVAAARDAVPALLDEVDRLRLSEASWSKEADRHERDHRAHYEERERLRAMLAEALDGWDRSARALVDDPHHEDERRIAELRAGV
jgi:hypothetical protein